MTNVLQVPVDGWTVDVLPGDVDFRYELVDGALLVTPPPDLLHAEVADALRQLLAGVLPPALPVLVEAGVSFDSRNCRESDVVVYRRAASVRGRIQSTDVVLAVEVMSPSSIANHRVAKPAQYAAARIADFWRVELDPLVLVTHVLDGDAYREAGRFVDRVEVRDPVALAFPLARLLD